MYKKWTINEIEGVIGEIAAKWNYPCTLPIEISNRAKSRLGAFFFRKSGNAIVPLKFVFANDLVSGEYSEKIVREVIIHEYLHYLCDTKTGINNGHNKLFKDACIKSGISSKATLRNTNNNINRITSKEYIIICKNCGTIVCIHKRIDAAERKTKYYISSCCKEKLAIKE